MAGSCSADVSRTVAIGGRGAADRAAGAARLSQVQGDAPTAPAAAGRRPLRVRVVRVAGLLIAAAAIAFCARAIADSWPETRRLLASAHVGWLLVALGCSAASMATLGLLWWRCLRSFGVAVGASSAVAWHFGGELGKYLPGGIWSLLGRGELAHRGGVPRSAGYGTTLVTYTCMAVAASLACGVLAPLSAVLPHRRGLGWGWALLALVPLGLAAVHPAVLQAALRTVRRLTGRRLDLDVPSWPAMLRLVAWGLPAWLLLGAAADAVTASLGLASEPVRVAFAAVAGWLVGFLALPVPAGAGVRELVFVLLCGLHTGPAAAVAAIARALLLVVDAAGGFVSLAWLARRRTAA